MPGAHVAGADADRDGEDGDFDAVHQIRGQVAAERLRLKLREVRSAHRELDDRERAQRQVEASEQARQAQFRAAAEREKAAVHQRALMEAAARREAAEAKDRLRARRRELIQEAKDKAVESWYLRSRLSSQLKAQILQAIEAALTPLAVEELPLTELVQIAEGVRDRLYAPAARAKEAAQALANNQKQLVAYGVEYAKRELEETEGIDVFERWRIEALVRQELQALTGREPRHEVRDLVDDILDREGLDLVDDDADD